MVTFSEQGGAALEHTYYVCKEREKVLRNLEAAE